MLNETRARASRLNTHEDLEAAVLELTLSLAQANRDLAQARADAEQYCAMFEHEAKERKFAEEALAKAEDRPNAWFLVGTDTDITRNDWSGARTQTSDAHSRLGRVVQLDELTRLHNNLAFHERLEQEVQRARQYQTHLSLIMLDLDHFKDYNDTYGHDAGDNVLKSVAWLLQQNARDVDFVARYGGDEFVVIAPAGIAGKSLVIAERLRAAFERAEWPHQQITASFGVTSFDAHPGLEALVWEAGEALARSKSDGRNRSTHARSA